MIEDKIFVFGPFIIFHGLIRGGEDGDRVLDEAGSEWAVHQQLIELKHKKAGGRNNEHLSSISMVIMTNRFLLSWRKFSIGF